MKRFLLASFVGASAALLSGQAMARTYFFSGTTCQPSTPAVASSLSYTQYGVHNTGSTAVVVECPLPTSNFGTLTEAVAFVYDRSTTDGVACDLQNTDPQGGVVFSTSLVTTGSGAAVKSLQYPIPTGTGGGGHWRLHCSIPAVQSGQFSHVTAINITMAGD